MKKISLFSVFAISSFILFAQPAKTGNKPVIKPAPVKQGPLKTLNDSASYAIGLSIGGFCKQYGFINPNKQLIGQSFSDVKNDRPFLLNEPACNDIVNKLLLQDKAVHGPVEGNHTDSSKDAMNRVDSVSYAIGLNHAVFFKQQGITGLDTSFIVKAVNDILSSLPTQFNDEVANKVMNKLIILMQEEKAKPVIDAGRAFLAKNKKKAGVKVTRTGLQYEIIRQGKGIRPAKIDTFICHYRGTLLDGTEFDASYTRNQPLVMGVSQVIRGWTEGLQLMPVGSKYKFYIPYELGYGPFDNPPIPGGSVLIFELELLNVKKAKPVPKAIIGKPVKK